MPDPPVEVEGRSWVLEINWAGRPFTANGRRHWAAQARLVKEWRDAGTMAARSAGLQGALFGRVEITTQARYRRNQLTDPANIAPCAKAVIDGLRDAKVFADDTGEFVASERFLPPWHDPTRPDALLVRVVEVLGEPE